MNAKKNRLGRGLDALLGDSGTELKGADPDRLQQMPVELLQRGRYQPRGQMDQESLDELASSIRKQGVLQPIVVRKLASGDYEIIAGERRWRASQLAGLDSIPAVIREVPDEAAIAMAQECRLRSPAGLPRTRASMAGLHGSRCVRTG